MLPPFNERGDLPPGVHQARWSEIGDRFGGSEMRRLLTRTLRHIHNLAAQTTHLIDQPRSVLSSMRNEVLICRSCPRYFQVGRVVVKTTRSCSLIINQCQASCGYAVTKRGVSISRSALQIARTTGAWPLGDSRRPSRIYFCPCADSMLLFTSVLSRFCHSAQRGSESLPLIPE